MEKDYNPFQARCLMKQIKFEQKTEEFLAPKNSQNFLHFSDSQSKKKINFFFFDYKIFLQFFPKYKIPTFREDFILSEIFLYICIVFSKRRRIVNHAIIIVQIVII